MVGVGVGEIAGVAERVGEGVSDDVEVDVGVVPGVSEIVRASPEFTDTINDDESTASKSRPCNRLNASTRFSSFQRRSCAPLTYQLLPLSARNMP